MTKKKMLQLMDEQKKLYARIELLSARINHEIQKDKRIRFYSVFHLGGALVQYFQIGDICADPTEYLKNKKIVKIKEQTW